MKIEHRGRLREVLQLLDILKLIEHWSKDIFDKMYEKCLSDLRFFLWYNDYTPIVELEYLTNLLCKKSLEYNWVLLDNSEYRNTRSSYDQEGIIQKIRISLFEKSFKSVDNRLLLDQILIKLGKMPYCFDIDYTIETIASNRTISQNNRNLFFEKVYEICDSASKFKMWRNGYVKEKDVNVIAENLPYLSGFEELFAMFENHDKLIILNKALVKYDIKDLLNIEQVSIFIDSAYFSKAINTKNKKDIFWILWFFKINAISADFISKEYSIEEFVEVIKKAKNKDNNYFSKIERFYSDLSTKYKIHLWLNELFGILDYIEFSKSYHELNIDEKKLFNKKVELNAQYEQFQAFIDQIPTAILVEAKYGRKTYKCKWRNIYFNYQRIQIFLNKNESTNDYYCPFSRQELNLLTQEYFSKRRIDDILVIVNNDNSIEAIEGLESIETQIIFAEIRKNGSIESRQKINKEEVIRMIHNVGERNKCINFLNEQNSPYNVVDIQELVTEVYGGLKRDISFLYCLPDNNENVYLIWESVEFEKSKATHIFKCINSEVENYIDIIKKFLESTIHSRSTLNSSEKNDLYQKRELNYFGRVMHDSKEYSVWESRMKNTLSFLK